MWHDCAVLLPALAREQTAAFLPCLPACAAFPPAICRAPFCRCSPSATLGVAPALPPLTRSRPCMRRICRRCHSCWPSCAAATCVSVAAPVAGCCELLLASCCAATPSAEGSAAGGCPEAVLAGPLSCPAARPPGAAAADMARCRRYSGGRRVCCWRSGSVWVASRGGSACRFCGLARAGRGKLRWCESSSAGTPSGSCPSSCALTRRTCDGICTQGAGASSAAWPGAKRRGSGRAGNADSLA